MPVHVAILRAEYLSMILDGRKTIESRLTRTPMPPFDRIKSGERIFFKQSSGPYRATAIAGDVRCERLAGPTQVAALQARFNDAICGAADYWHLKRDARFATLVSLQQVQATDQGPRIAPSQGMAWFVLDDAMGEPQSAGAMFSITLSPAMLRNHYVIVPPEVHKFAKACYGGRRKSEAGKAVTLLLPGGVTITSDLTPNGMFRWRGWGQVLRELGADSAGTIVRFTEISPTTFSVRFVRAN
jgi:hypothetical protein